MGQVVVDVARDHVEVEPLGPPRRVVHVERERIARAVGEPLLDGEAVAARLGDLLAVLVEEELVDEAGGRSRPERAADLPRDVDGADQVLARHLVVDAERMPAHGPVGLPLQLAVAARHRDGHRLAVLVHVAHRARLGVAGRDGHLQHAAGLGAERQEGAVSGLPLGAQRRQDDAHDLVVAAKRVHERAVELAGAVGLARALERVVEAEIVEEGAQTRVVVRPEALVRAERIGDLRERLAQVLLDHRTRGDVVGHLPEPIHVVGEGDEARRDVAEHGECTAHHGRARDFAEGADVGQARGAVAGLEQRIALGRRLAAEALQQRRGLLERPSLGALGKRPQVVRRVGHVPCPKAGGTCAGPPAPVNRYTPPQCRRLQSHDSPPRHPPRCRCRARRRSWWRRGMRSGWMRTACSPGFPTRPRASAWVPWVLRPTSATPRRSRAGSASPAWWLWTCSNSLPSFIRRGSRCRRCVDLPGRSGWRYPRARRMRRRPCRWRLLGCSARSRRRASNVPGKQPRLRAPWPAPTGPGAMR